MSRAGRSGRPARTLNEVASGLARTLALLRPRTYRQRPSVLVGSPGEQPGAGGRTGTKAMSRKVRVLFVFNSLEGRGAERVALETALGLDRERFQPSLWVLRQEGELWDRIPAGMRVSVVLGAGERLRDRRPAVLRSLLAAAWRSDVVVGAVELLPTYLALIAGRLTGRPTVGWVHNSMELVYRDLPAYLGRLSRVGDHLLTRLVFVSQGTRDTLQRLHRLPGERLSVIHNSYDLAQIQEKRATSLPEWAGFMSERPCVLGVGRLTRQKGFDLLIEAHALLRARGGTHQLVILGEGPDRASLEALVRERGLSDSVHLPGAVTNPYAFLARATVFALSSRYEGLPGVVIEALACGTPIVAVNCPSGPDEILEGGRFGKLVPPDDVPALADGIESLLGDEELRTRLSEAGPGRARDFSPERTIPRWEELLGSLAGRRAGLTLSSRPTGRGR